jgi:hypothetical protein
VVECAVEARITLKVVDQSVWGLLDLPWLSQILVEIGAPSAAVNSSADNNKEQPAAKKKKKRLTKKKKKKP